MRPPLRWLVSCPATLVGYVFLWPLLAIAIAVVRRRGSGSPYRFKSGELFLLLILSFVSFNDFPLRVVLIPFWVYYFVRYLQTSHERLVPERMAIVLALSGAFLDGLSVLGVMVGHPSIEAVRSTHIALAWLVLGGVVLGEAHRPGNLAILRVGLLVIGGLAVWRLVSV